MGVFGILVVTKYEKVNKSMNFNKHIKGVALAGLMLGAPTSTFALSVGDSISSGGLSFTVLSCAGQEASCADDVTMVAASDGIGFDLAFTDFSVSTGDTAKDITISWIVSGANDVLSRLRNVTLGVTGVATGGGLVETVEQQSLGAAVPFAAQVIGEGPAPFGITDSVAVVSGGQSVTAFNERAFTTDSFFLFSKDNAVDVDGVGTATLSDVSQRFAVAPVPVPASLGFLLAGLAGFGVLRQRRAS